MSGEAAVDWERNAKHEAGAWTAEPEDGCGDLVGAAQSPDRLISHDLGHRVRLRLEHVVNHRGVDRARADGVDADAPRRIFECGALGEPDHAVLARVIGRAAGKAHEAAER